VILAPGSVLEVADNRLEAIATQEVADMLHAITLRPVSTYQAVNHIGTGRGEELGFIDCVSLAHRSPPHTKGTSFRTRLLG